ncbi:hypothetical protein C8Q75DRAFT_484363 [Abortiporus biennis]|nr:hypothetical protein C8Q75DRAFT_484363 [Abortiporus biennis]
MSASLHLDDTLGAIFVGNLIGAILHGVVCDQTYAYYMINNRKDGWLLKTLVAILWIGSSVQLAFGAHQVYYFSITNYNDPSVLNREPWSMFGFNTISNINDVLIRGIFIYRVMRLSKNMVLTLILWFGNLTISGLAFGLSTQILIIGDLNNLGKISWLLCTQFSVLALVDTAIAFALCVFLWRLKTGFIRTDSQLENLMMYSIHTGVLTSVAAIVIVITYAAMPHKFIYIAIYMPLSKLYLSALLAMLNARETMRAGMNSGIGCDISTNQLSKILATNAARNVSDMPQRLGEIDTDTAFSEKAYSTGSKLDIKVSKTVIISRDDS